MRTGWRRTNAVLPWPGCPTSGNVIPTIGPMRSHGSRRACRRGAGTAARRTPGPVPVTVSGSPGLFTQLTASQQSLRCRGLKQHLGCSNTTIHAGAARRNVQPTWTAPGEALFPGHLPQRRVTFPTVGRRVEVWVPSHRLGWFVQVPSRAGWLARQVRRCSRRRQCRQSHALGTR